ncbi:MAG: 4Fe-4S dicluster domain-containing protein [Anaerolineae bacterium]|jgi:ferredoxin like protein
METQLDLKLDTLVFKPDLEPHIVIDKKRCLDCEARPCTVVCPAGLYVWLGDQLTHNCDGCLECGSCRAVCPRDAIEWRYPRGGYGVRYRWG